jgi:hypothetical protein
MYASLDHDSAGKNTASVINGITAAETLGITNPASNDPINSINRHDTKPPSPPVVRADIDDHQISTLGKGYTLGIMAAELEITQEQINQLPEELRTGLFAKPGKYESLIRVSHTSIVEVLDVMRYALKIHIGEENNHNNDSDDDGDAKCKENKKILDSNGTPHWSNDIDLLFTESVNWFPIADDNQLNAFTYVVADRLASAIKKAGNAFYYVGGVLGLVDNKSKLLTDETIEKVQTTSVLNKNYYSMTPYELGGKAIMKYTLSCGGKDSWNTKMSKVMKETYAAAISLDDEYWKFASN